MGIGNSDTMYDVKDERVVFPIKYKGRIVDAVGRAVGKKQHPKWYRYTGEADYYMHGNGKILLIVEDVLSAIIAYIRDTVHHIYGYTRYKLES